MARCVTDLSTRSDQAELPPSADGVQAGPSVALLSAEADADGWRILEVFSRSGRPFEVDVAWSSGSGSGARATVTVASATRIGLFARSLTVRAASLAAETHRVGINVADGKLVTRNQHEVRGSVSEGGPLIVPVPPFATHARVELGVLNLDTVTQVRVLDAFDTARSVLLASQQPSGGIPVGGAAALRISHNQSLADARVVFQLSL